MSGAGVGSLIHLRGVPGVEIPSDEELIAMVE
jgi:hypothetical protein